MHIYILFECVDLVDFGYNYILVLVYSNFCTTKQYTRICNQYYCTVVYILIIYMYVFCHGTSLKKKHLASWELEPARRSQATDMLRSRPSCVPERMHDVP